MNDAEPQPTQIETFDDYPDWGSPVPPTPDPIAMLESGALLLLPQLAFRTTEAELVVFGRTHAAAKNVSLAPGATRVRGMGGGPAEQRTVLEMLSRFSDRADALVRTLFSHYGPQLRRARASFRPTEIAGRQTSWRHDDTRLHVDSFPATPSGAQRILRVFTNVNPDGHPRVWRVGEPFEAVAGRFLPQLRQPFPLSGLALQLFGLTKSRRTRYDALMLQLHDAMKRDTTYQRHAGQQSVAFPSGATWVAFTDQVSHAAMAGQYQLEQTFLVPVAAMRAPERSPLRILERLTGRRLV